MKKVILALSLAAVLSACVDNTRVERRPADDQNPNAPTSTTTTQERTTHQ